MKIVSRSEWGARPASATTRINTPTPRLWVHHTAGNESGAAGVRSIQAFHMDSRGWLDIAYSFLIDSDGTIYEGRGAGVAGAHTAGDNSSSHAACLMGNFETEAPTSAAIAALVDLARHGREQGWWTPTLGGHRDAPGASTACPGQHLYDRLPDVRSQVDSSSSPATPKGFLMAVSETEQREALERIHHIAMALQAEPGVRHNYLPRDVEDLKAELAKLAPAELAERIHHIAMALQLEPGERVNYLGGDIQQLRVDVDAMKGDLAAIKAAVTTTNGG